MLNTVHSEISTPEIEQLLLKRQQQLEDELRLIENDDPLNIYSAESTDLGDDSLQAEVHAKILVTRNRLLELVEKIKQAIIKLKNGTYGQCEHCGHYIAPERLKAIPMAVLCGVCVTIISQPH